MYYKKILKDVNQNPGEETHRTSSVLFSSVAQWWLTLCNSMDCSMPGLPSHHQLPELIQTHVCDAIHPSISSSVIPFSSHLQSFPGSGSFQMSQFFAWGCQSIGVPVQPKNKSKQKLENFKLKFNISPSSEYSGLISFRMDWLDFLAVQATLKSLLQHHSSKESILRPSAL